MRQTAPAGCSGPSNLTNAGTSSVRIQACESGGIRPSTVAETAMLEDDHRTLLQMLGTAARLHNAAWFDQIADDLKSRIDVIEARFRSFEK